mgnify:FL=1
MELPNFAREGASLVPLVFLKENVLSIFGSVTLMKMRVVGT